MLDVEKCPDKPRLRNGSLTKLLKRVVLLLILYLTMYFTFFVITSQSDKRASMIVFSTSRCSCNTRNDTAEFMKLRRRLEKIETSDKLKYKEDKPIDQSPTLEYETIRRRVYSNTKDALDYIAYELEKAIQDSNNTIRLQRLRTLIENVHDRKSKHRENFKVEARFPPKWKEEERCVLNNQSDYVISTSFLLASVEIDQDEDSALLADQKRMWAADGYAEWRKREASEVSALVQSRLRALQNPPNCEAARKLICDFTKFCGFGCQLHHVMFCMNFAFATRRTLVLQSYGWYYNDEGWQDIFRPLSVNCTQVGKHETNDQSKIKNWSAALDLDWKVLQLSPYILEEIATSDFKAKFLPPALPEDLAERISRINGDPPSWWMGQLLRYILRPRADVADEVYRTIANMSFSNNTVGIHIRRTDKLFGEADFHPVYEYMNQVKDYWRIQDLFTGTTVPRRVYIATDDPTVKEKATKTYPDVEFLGDQKIASYASDLFKRHSPTSIVYVIAELALLERCDYFVGTFSSNIRFGHDNILLTMFDKHNIGRLVYELMQANRPDASESIYSLDEMYYISGQSGLKRIALFPHIPKQANEIELQKGDIITLKSFRKIHRAYGYGTNQRTNKTGHWPWYKTEYQAKTYPFPTFENENHPALLSIGLKFSDLFHNNVSSHIQPYDPVAFV